VKVEFQCCQVSTSRLGFGCSYFTSTLQLVNMGLTLFVFTFFVFVDKLITSGRTSESGISMLPSVNLEVGF